MKWCRFLGVPPNGVKVAIVRPDAFDLEEATNAAGFPACVVRSPGGWLTHEPGALSVPQYECGTGWFGDAPLLRTNTTSHRQGPVVACRDAVLLHPPSSQFMIHCRRSS